MTEISDEMVEKAVKAYSEYWIYSGTCGMMVSPDALRAALAAVAPAPSTNAC